MTLPAVSEVADDGTWMMSPGAGAARTWPILGDVCCLQPGEPGDMQKRVAVEIATEVLWRATAQQFGLTHEIIRPCLASCAQATPRQGRSYLLDCGCAHRGAICRCSDTPAIQLPGPVFWQPLAQPPDWTRPFRPEDAQPELDPLTIATRYRLIVWVDGTPLLEPGWPLEWAPGQTLPDNYTPAQGDFWVDDDDQLVRTDGQAWPTCQDLTRPLQARAAHPDEARGTFGVEYWRGTPVPLSGQRAVTILACELWKSYVRDSTCRLPKNVQSITREGVEYTLIDPTDYLKGNRTGLPDVDMWISSVNPHGHRSAPVVFSPDLPTFRSGW